MAERLVRDAPFCSVRGQHGIRKGFITCSSTVARKARSYYPVFAKVGVGRGCWIPARALPYMHRSAWKEYSPKFVVTEASEVRGQGLTLPGRCIPRGALAFSMSGV